MMQKPANASSKVPHQWQIWKRSSFDTFLANMANVHCNTLVANMAFPSAIYAALRLCALYREFRDDATMEMPMPPDEYVSVAKVPDICRLQR